jgi:hypothetical protein
MGFGLGGCNSNLRYVRIGAIIALLLFGALSHDSGAGYTTFRLFYFALIIGLLMFSFRSRGVRRPSAYRQQSNASNNPIETRIVDAPDAAFPNATQPGWYPHPDKASLQRYWDGSAWGATRQWNGSSWVQR